MVANRPERGGERDVYHRVEHIPAAAGVGLGDGSTGSADAAKGFGMEPVAACWGLMEPYGRGCFVPTLPRWRRMPPVRSRGVATTRQRMPG